MQRVFDRSATGLEAGRELLRLRQGHNTVSDFAIDFQTLAVDSGWEGWSLVDAFLHGLVEPVKHELLTCELPDDLERIIALAIRVDARLEDWRQTTRARSPLLRRPAPRRRPSPPPRLTRNEAHHIPPSTPRGESEAMIVDHSRVSQEERERRRRERACFRCGEGGHYADQCPVKERAH